mgnify:CR=1 FL=1
MIPLSLLEIIMKPQDFAMAGVVTATLVYVGLIVGGLLWMFETFLTIITK